MSTFLLNVSSNRYFGDAIAVQDLREINYEILTDVPSSNYEILTDVPSSNHQTFGAAPKHILVYNLVMSHDLKIQKLQ